MQTHLEENIMIKFLQKFDEYPFLIKYQNNTYQVGKGEPTFIVHFKKEINIKELTKSTSLALGEAYMRGDLEIEGDLYMPNGQVFYRPIRTKKINISFQF